eukprot:TRINITY_DN3526_c0_g6_i1.p1 TRINITY_DN3526_c0_g6~~TRINITY_DN3526_c0_g6_i1.p1  ORF type:complete len:134 (+),score=24.31 TRINITY_DN3526_c0_g6_i1:25-402(+)
MKHPIRENYKLKLHFNPSLAIASNFTCQLKAKGLPVNISPSLDGNAIAINDLPYVASDDVLTIIIEDVKNPAVGNYPGIFVDIENNLGEVIMKSKEIIAEVTLSLIHICRCRRYAVCRSRWSPYH